MSQQYTLVSFSRVKKITGYSRSQIDRMEKAGNFPRRVQRGRNAVGWFLHEVIAWVESRPRGFLARPRKAAQPVRKKRS